MTTVYRITTGNIYKSFGNSHWCNSKSSEITMQFVVSLYEMFQEENGGQDENNVFPDTYQFEYLSCSDLLNHVLEYCRDITNSLYMYDDYGSNFNSQSLTFRHFKDYAKLSNFVFQRNLKLTTSHFIYLVLFIRVRVDTQNKLTKRKKCLVQNIYRRS